MNNIKSLLKNNKDLVQLEKYMKNNYSDDIVFERRNLLSKEFIQSFNIPSFANKCKGKPIIHNESEVGPKANLRYDIIRKIIRMKKHKDTIICRVSFRQRPSGFKPKRRWISNALLKKYAPYHLAKFYEENIQSA